MASLCKTLAPRAQPSRRTTGLLVVLSLFVLGLCGYVTTLGWCYVSDDYFLIALQCDERGSVDWGRAARSLCGFAPRDGNAIYFRPVWMASYALDAALCATASVSRSADLAFHAGCGVLLAFVVRRLGAEGWVAWLAGALFVVSPVPIQGVVWVAARCDLLACFFSLAALALVVSERSGETSWPRRLLTGVAALAAWSSKETALGLAPLLSVVAVLRAWPAQDLRSLAPALRTGLRRTASIWLFFGGYLIWRWTQLGSVVGGHSDEHVLDFTAGGVLSSLSTLGFPVTSPANEHLRAETICAVVLPWLAWVAWRSLRRPEDLRVAVLSGAWLVLASMPVLNKVVSSWQSESTRQLYFPSAAWCALFALSVALTLRALRVDRPWTRVVIASALLSFSLYHLRVRLAPYERAAHEMRVMTEWFAQLEQEPGAPLLVHGLTDTVGPGLCARNAFPACCRPPFRDYAPGRQVVFETDISMSWDRISGRSIRSLLRAENEFALWALAPAERVTTRPPILPPSGRGFARRDAAGSWYLALDQEGPLDPAVALGGPLPLEFEGAFVECSFAPGDASVPLLIACEVTRPRLAARTSRAEEGLEIEFRAEPGVKQPVLMLDDRIAPLPIGKAGVAWLRTETHIPMRLDAATGTWRCNLDSLAPASRAGIAQVLYWTSEGGFVSEGLRLSR